MFGGSGSANFWLKVFPSFHPFALAHYHHSSRDAQRVAASAPEVVPAEIAEPGAVLSAEHVAPVAEPVVPEAVTVVPGAAVVAADVLPAVSALEPAVPIDEPEPVAP